jgi:hypothetical protein
MWRGSVSAGKGLYSAGGSLALGTNDCGKKIWDATLGWAPAIALGPPVSVAGGKSYTWAFGSY